MSVLSRWGRTRADVGAVCFISRNLLPEDASGLFNRIDGLHDDLGVPLLVVPCDEQGVCAARLGDLDGVRGLPVYFLGVRPWLRRRIAERYGLVLQTEHPRLGALRAEVERASNALLNAEQLRRTVEETVTHGAQRAVVLASVEPLISSARGNLREALRRYHEVMFLRGGA
ncbi:MAG: hypothetical protein U0326_25920 [Polyangiales bacterium]